MSKTENHKTSISQKISKLDESVDWFYGEDFEIDQALVQYQKAAQLAQEIKEDLHNLKNQVEVVEDFTKS